MKLLTKLALMVGSIFLRKIIDPATPEPVLEEVVCPRRVESALSANFPPPDHWIRRGENIYRSCSYCGSIHPDDAADLLSRGLARLERTTKGYKYYLEAVKGGPSLGGCCKLYTPHLDGEAHFMAILTADRTGKLARPA